MSRVVRIVVLLVFALVLALQAWRALKSTADMQFRLARRAIERQRVDALTVRLGAELRAATLRARSGGLAHLAVDPSLPPEPTRRTTTPGEAVLTTYDAVWQGLHLAAARAAPPNATLPALVVVDGVGFFTFPSPGPGVVVVEAEEVFRRIVGRRWENAFSAIHLEPSPGTFLVFTDGILEGAPALWVEAAADDVGLDDLLGTADPTGWTLLLTAAVLALLLEAALGLRLLARASARTQERSALLDRLSHNLRTPAAAVASLSVTLGELEDANVEDRRALFEALTEEANRWTVGVRRLLVAARGGAPAAADAVPLDAREWIGGVVERWRHRVSGIELSIGTAEDEPMMVEADPEQLEEALEVLLDNAVKYGKPPIRVAIEGAADKVGIVVEDAGEGIPLEDRARMFERLERGRRGQGFGLGLWAAARIAEAHRGSLALEGASRFVLRLPRIR